MLAERFGRQLAKSLSAEQSSGGYIRGRLRRIGAQRIAAQSPLYALFFPPLSFSRKKKVVKNEQPKYLSIYFDRGSEIGLSRHKHFFALKIKAWQRTFQFPTAPPPPTAVPLPLHRGGFHTHEFSVHYQLDFESIFNRRRRDLTPRSTENLYPRTLPATAHYTLKPRSVPKSFFRGLSRKTSPRQRGTHYITRTYQIGFSEVLRKPRRPGVVMKKPARKIFTN